VLMIIVQSMISCLYLNMLLRVESLWLGVQNYANAFWQGVSRAFKFKFRYLHCTVPFLLVLRKLNPMIISSKTRQVSYSESYLDFQESYQAIQLCYRTRKFDWNVLCLLRSEVAYIGTGHILT
jgi:hypothetical protein